MPRSVPFSLLNEMLHCTVRGFRPRASNSAWHQERAKKPRSSSYFCSSMTKAPGNFVSQKTTIDPHLRDRHHQLAAPLANIRQLLADFLFQIPRQDQHVIGLGFTNPAGVEYRNVCSGQEFSMLVRVSVDSVIEKVAANAAVIEKRVPFAGRTITNDRFLFPFYLNQKIQNFALGFFYLFCK